MCNTSLSLQFRIIGSWDDSTELNMRNHMSEQQIAVNENIQPLHVLANLHIFVTFLLICYGMKREHVLH